MPGSMRQRTNHVESSSKILPKLSRGHNAPASKVASPADPVRGDELENGRSMAAARNSTWPISLGWPDSWGLTGLSRIAPELGPTAPRQGVRRTSDDRQAAVVAADGQATGTDQRQGGADGRLLMDARHRPTVGSDGMQDLGIVTEDDDPIRSHDRRSTRSVHQRCRSSGPLPSPQRCRPAPPRRRGPGPSRSDPPRCHPRV